MTDQSRYRKFREWYEGTGSSAAGPLVLSADDVLAADADDLVPKRCDLCPAQTRSVLMRMVVARHARWKTYEAASVAVRRCCQHHADQLLAQSENGWMEYASWNEKV